MATNLAALRAALPVPSLAAWLLNEPGRVERLLERHCTDERLCAGCGELTPCRYNQWATEAQEYLSRQVAPRHEAC